MSNGRAIKRNIQKNQQEQQPQALQGPEGAMRPPSSQDDLDMGGAEFLQGAREGASYEGRSDHLMSMVDPEELENVPPELQKQLETMNAMMIDMIYRPETKDAIREALQAGPPEQTIPYATNMVLRQFENFTEQSQGPMPLELKFASGIGAFGEITEMAQGTGLLPKEMPEDQTESLLKATMEQYVIRGLKEKTIDPVELQLKVEPLLTPEEQLIARQQADQVGIPQRPTSMMAQQKTLQSKMMPLERENKALRDGNQQLEGALTKVSEAVPEGGA